MLMQMDGSIARSVPSDSSSEQQYHRSDDNSSTESSDPLSNSERSQIMRQKMSKLLERERLSKSTISYPVPKGIIVNDSNQRDKSNSPINTRISGELRSPLSSLSELLDIKNDNAAESSRNATITSVLQGLNSANSSQQRKDQWKEQRLAASRTIPPPLIRKNSPSPLSSFLVKSNSARNVAASVFGELTEHQSQQESVSRTSSSTPSSGFAHASLSSFLTTTTDRGDKEVTSRASSSTPASGFAHSSLSSFLTTPVDKGESGEGSTIASDNNRRGSGGESTVVVANRRGSFDGSTVVANNSGESTVVANNTKSVANHTNTSSTKKPNSDRGTADASTDSTSGSLSISYRSKEQKTIISVDASVLEMVGTVEEHVHGRKERQTALCCGSCCDVRRACMIIDIIYPIFVLWGLYRYSTGGGVWNYSQEEVREIYTDYVYRVAALVQLSIGLVCSLIGLRGTIKFKKYMVLVTAVWYSIDAVTYLVFFNWPCSLIMILYSYPHFTLFQALKNGIMTPENYKETEQYCCCVNVRRYDDFEDDEEEGDMEDV